MSLYALSTSSDLRETMVEQATLRSSKAFVPKQDCTFETAALTLVACSTTDSRESEHRSGYGYQASSPYGEQSISVRCLRVIVHDCRT
jgi:hypothetical protein